MNILQKTHVFNTRARGMTNITSDLQSMVTASQIQTGLCHVYIHHTSAALIITENADPDVLLDLENYLLRLVPDGDPRYHHDAEGKDDMAAHIRSVLTQTKLSLPITQGRMALGTWQAVFLYEHRAQSHTRQVTQTLQGS